MSLDTPIAVEVIDGEHGNKLLIEKGGTPLTHRVLVTYRILAQIAPHPEQADYAALMARRLAASYNACREIKNVSDIEDGVISELLDQRGLS